MKVGEILAKQLEKLGIDTTSEELKPILGISVDVPETLTGKLDSLITMDGAKNNTDIKNHYIKKYTSGINQALDEKLKKLGMTQDQVDDIFKEETFGKRIEGALERLAEAKDNLAKTKKTGDVDSEKLYKDQIDKLNKDLADIKEASKTEREKLMSDFENEKINEEVGREFLSKPWSKHYPDSANDKLVIANTYLQNELQQIGAKIVRDFDTKQIKLVQAKNPELDYFDSSNKKVNFTSLVAKIAADKKLLAVSESSGQGTPTPSTIVGGQAPQGTLRTNNPALNALRQSQQDQAQNYTS